MAKHDLKNTQPRYSSAYWGIEIGDAKSRHDETFWKEANESIRVYNTKFKLEAVQRRVNVWWYIVNTLQPAYYSSTPKAEVNLRKYAGSQIFDLSAVLLERNTQYSMDMDFDFDFVGLNSSIQFLLTGRAVLWAKYVAENGEPKRIKMGSSDKGIVDAEGRPYEGDPDDLEEAEDGVYLNMPHITGEKAVLESVQYNDYLNSDARNEEEVTWRAKRAYLTREEAESLFDKSTASKLNYDSYPDKDNKNQTRSATSGEHSYQNGRAEMWELWSEEQNKIHWIQDRGKRSIVETGDVVIKYAGFYPCSVINASVDPDSTIPVSDYTHTKDQILEVERLAERKHALIQSIRPNGIYDATRGDLIGKMFSGDLKLEPAINWPSHKAQGGMANAIEYLNIDPYVAALQVVSQEYAAAKQDLFQTLKVSDLLQGMSDPRKTATANRLENAWSSMGLIVRQNQFAKFIGDGLEKLGTIIASQFDKERLLDRGDAQGLITPLCTDQQGQVNQQQYQQLADQIIAPLKDSRELFKLQIASDSMVALDQKQERADAADLLNSAGAFFDQMKNIVVEYPALMPWAIGLLETVMRSYKGGKELEALFTKAMGDVSASAQQKQAAAAQQQQDPKLLIAQMAEQSKTADRQAKMQVEQMKSQNEAFQAQMLQQSKQQEGSLKQWVAQQELAVKNRGVDVDLIKIQSDAGIASVNQEIARMQTQIAGTLDALKLGLEKKDMEHKQLVDAVQAHQSAREHTDNHIAALAGIVSSAEQKDKANKLKEGMSKVNLPEPKVTPIKRPDRIHTIISDGQGNPVGIKSSDASETPPTPGSLKL